MHKVYLATQYMLCVIRKVESNRLTSQLCNLPGKGSLESRYFYALPSATVTVMNHCMCIVPHNIICQKKIFRLFRHLSSCIAKFYYANVLSCVMMYTHPIPTRVFNKHNNTTESVMFGINMVEY
jgi:hypothetical protein